MTQPLEGFYERELVFLEDTAPAFSERYPAQARHLLHEEGRNVDPHLERFIEGFALLAGRVHHKLDSEFPELTDSLLQLLYPHLGLVMPSMAIAQAEVTAPARALCQGWRLEQDTLVRSQAFGREAVSCQYRLGYPLTVWPIELTSISWETSPFDPTFRPPPRTVAVLRLCFSCRDGLCWEDLSLDKLRLHLSGERQLMAGLYEILFNRCLGVTFQAADGSAPPLSVPADECLFQVGLDVAEGLLPFPPEAFLGYRLLMELMSFPQKFLFADLAGWEQIRGRGFGGQVEVLLFFSHSQENLERGLSAENFLLGCTPVVNLFRKSAEPIDCNHLQPDYRVVPARGKPLGMEVYHIESVGSFDGEAGCYREVRPFYAGDFAQTEERPAYWYAGRRASLTERDPGTEVFITLVDPDFHPAKPCNVMLDVQAWCTNRDLPSKHQQAGDRLLLDKDDSGVTGWLTLLHKPTPALRPALRRETYWQLLAQNCLNHVSLVEGKESLQALQELMRLCDFSGPATQQLAAVNQQIVEGIKSIHAAPLMGRTSSSNKWGPCRGMKLQIEFDEQKYVGTGVLLVASVLDRFFGLYTAVNSFTQLVAKTAQAEGALKTWPSRAGAYQLH